MMNEKKANILATQIAEGISAGLADVMKPVFDNLANEIRSLQENIEVKQKESIKIMADEFIKEMKNSSDKMFDKISKDTIEISKMQADSVDKLAGIVEKMESDIAAYKKLSEDNAKLCESIKEMCGSLDKRIDSLAKISDDIAKIDGNVSAHMQTEKELAGDIAACSKTVLNTINDSTQQLNESAANVLGKIEECSNKLDDASVKLKTSYESTKAIMIKSLGEYQITMKNDMGEAFESFDNNMAAVVKVLGDAVSEISEMTMNIPKALKGSIDELSQTLKR